jgi:hypothetical protein
MLIGDGVVNYDIRISARVRARHQEGTYHIRTIGGRDRPDVIQTTLGSRWCIVAWRWVISEPFTRLTRGQIGRRGNVVLVKARVPGSRPTT